MRAPSVTLKPTLGLGLLSEGIPKRSSLNLLILVLLALSLWQKNRFVRDFSDKYYRSQKYLM